VNRKRIREHFALTVLHFGTSPGKERGEDQGDPRRGGGVNPHNNNRRNWITHKRKSEAIQKTTTGMKGKKFQ